MDNNHYIDYFIMQFQSSLYVMSNLIITSQYMYPLAPFKDRRRKVYLLQWKYK